MAFLFLDTTNDTHILKATGQWDKNTLTTIETMVATYKAKPILVNAIDLHDITSMDTSGALLLYRLQHYLEKPKGQCIEFLYNTYEAAWTDLFQQVGIAQQQMNIAIIDKSHRYSWVYDRLSIVGHIARDFGNDLYSLLALIGAIAFTLPKRSRGGSNPISLSRRLAPFTQQLNDLGVKATPIVMLLAFIIGAIMAQQGAFQLRNFGAEIFVVDLTSILIFRELGVFITSILVAGRCGSAITAELGVMKMREEVDALQVMGLDVFKTLYLPRIAALVVALPLLTIFANIAALAGAAVMIHCYSHISYRIFLSRMQNDIYLSTYFIGFIKSPFLAFVIALISIMEGLKIKDSTQILGQRITSSVVKSIFCAIIIDGVFAILLAWLNY